MLNITSQIAPKVNNIYNQNSKYNNRNRQQTFTGLNVSKGYDAFCNGVGKYFCRPLFNNGVIDKLGFTIRNADNAVKHFLAVGSVITSGMYMHQTYTNKKMDKDRRQTLTANQFLTLVLSTAGAYTLDSSIKSWWSKQHEKYLRLSAAGNAVWDGMNEMNSQIKAKNADINADITAKVERGELKPDLQIENDKALGKLAKKFTKSDKDGTFASRLKSIGIEVSDAKDKKGLVKEIQKAILSGTPETKEQLLKAIQAEDFVRKLISPKIDINTYIDKFGSQHVVDKTTLKNLKIRSKGFAALRSILVFGFVYRFFVPLAVVKPTNWLCDKYLEHKKAKQAEKSQNIAA